MSNRPRIESVNDFVVKFANVNGSGSASANELFARSLLRMGVPVSPRNIFPSNIQGLPTWYEVRVCEHGWLGRRGGVDLMVAMNPQTWERDIAEGLKTGRVMVKDEDVCLHCGLCAERCPTGAWDMQKFSLVLPRAGKGCRPAAPKKVPALT